jgi:hypothetical protein
VTPSIPTPYAITVTTRRRSRTFTDHVATFTEVLDLVREYAETHVDHEIEVRNTALATSPADRDGLTDEESDAVCDAIYDGRKAQTAEEDARTAAAEDAYERYVAACDEAVDMAREADL